MLDQSEVESLNLLRSLGTLTQDQALELHRLLVKDEALKLAEEEVVVAEAKSKKVKGKK